MFAVICSCVKSLLRFVRPFIDVRAVNGVVFQVLFPPGVGVVPNASHCYFVYSIYTHMDDYYLKSYIYTL